MTQVFSTTSGIDADRLIEFSSKVYQSIGVSKEDASFAADTLVQADLWGHQSHGVLRLAWYYARLKSGAMKPQTNIKTIVDAGAIGMIDGQDGLGPMVARAATLQACDRAKKHGSE
jgi:LDH2 family malate/lactate/ureidoglycolate dehydrogenase